MVYELDTYYNFENIFQQNKIAKQLTLIKMEATSTAKFLKVNIVDYR
jgi:hypothetical protein